MCVECRPFYTRKCVHLRKCMCTRKYVFTRECIRKYGTSSLEYDVEGRRLDPEAESGHAVKDAQMLCKA